MVTWNPRSPHGWVSSGVGCWDLVGLVDALRFAAGAEQWNAVPAPSCGSASGSTKGGTATANMTVLSAKETTTMRSSGSGSVANSRDQPHAAKVSAAV